MALLMQRAESAVGLALFQFQTDNIWIGLGILYNLMLYLLLFILGAVRSPLLFACC